jgi:hypothetical protein
MVEEKKEHRYVVSITGKNTNFECPIDSISDFEDLEHILKTLKKKIQGY